MAVVAGFGAAKADTITVKHAGESTAKVECVPSKGKSATVPIKFEEGANWDSVKDTYNVSPETAHALMAKKECISIDSNGTAHFMARASHAKYCKAKKK
jgi:hypothetical protein